MHMENRRQSLRHYYPAAERFPVTLKLVDRHAELNALLLDLGLEGMRVRLEDEPPPLCLDQSLLAHLELPGLAESLSVTCAVVYLERIGSAQECGLRFLPLLLPAANDRRERLLWKYLMNEQRRTRKKRRGPGVTLRLFTGD